MDGFSASGAAEILLRCGSLIGFYGHIEQISEGQIISKDLLMNARSRFLELGNSEKVAECENYLALAYWRTGESHEADAWIDEAISHELPVYTDTRLYSQVIRDLNFLSLKRYDVICGNFLIWENHFFVYADNFLKGNLYNNYGVALKNLGQIEKALDNLEIGRDFYHRSGNKVHCGLAENNLAQLYRTQSRYQKAHAAVDRATQLFKQIKDKTREGFSFDTKALIYKEEARYTEALATVEKGIKILRKSENLAYLAETCLTKSKILLHLDDFTASVLSLIEAVEIARTQSGEEYSIKMIGEFERELNEAKSVKRLAAVVENFSAANDMELILPPSIAHFNDYTGVWIKNGHLESIGLRKGSLAIVVDQEVKRGELAAISEVGENSVTCGFFDKDFGIISLEGIDGEPLLFDEKEVKIIGKIVGVCRPEKDGNGKMVVEAIVL